MLQPGTLIEGQYRIDKLVGVGGMGLVYQAVDERTQSRVAVKVMRSALDSDSEVVRFHREARALGKLDHPNIVRVHQAGVLADGEPYMVMELLIGRDLRTELRQRGSLPIDEVAGYMLQVCDAVFAAHDQNVIHRDLKPQNLFVTQLDGDRQIKLLDFGISKLSVDGEATATGTADILGTPHYMSPEQVRSTKDVDHRTDIWSLGVVMYYLTTGKLPFAHPSPTAVIAAIPFEEPKPPSWLRADLPPALEEIILRCLRKDPNERFRDARELMEALKPLAPDEHVRVEGATGPMSLPTLPTPKGEGQHAVAAATQRAGRPTERKPSEITTEPDLNADVPTAPASPPVLPESMHSLASTVGFGFASTAEAPAASASLKRKAGWTALAVAFALLAAFGLAQAFDHKEHVVLDTPVQAPAPTPVVAPIRPAGVTVSIPPMPEASAKTTAAVASSTTERQAQKPKRRAAATVEAPTPPPASDHNPSHL